MVSYKSRRTIQKGDNKRNPLDYPGGHWWGGHRWTLQQLQTRPCFFALSLEHGIEVYAWKPSSLCLFIQTCIHPFIYSLIQHKTSHKGMQIAKETGSVFEEPTLVPLPQPQSGISRWTSWSRKSLQFYGRIRDLWVTLNLIWISDLPYIIANNSEIHNLQHKPSPRICIHSCLLNISTGISVLTQT